MDDETQNTAQPSQQDTSSQQTGGLRTLANGAVLGANGKFVANPGGGTTAITSDTAHNYLARREQLRAQAQLASQLEIGKRVPTGLALDAWGRAVGAQYDLAMDTDRNVSVKAFENVGRATGFLVDERHSTQDVNINHNLPDFSAVRRLLAAVSGELEGEGQVIDADWTDLE